jgi:phage baseplate assembly protein W
MTFVSNVPGSVSVVTAPTPSSELAVPFQIGPDGRVATVSDAVKKVAQHLISLALTAPGERVMRSSYGVGLSRMTFENASIGQFEMAARTLQAAFQSAESGVNNVTVSVVQSVGQQYLFKVFFTLDQSPIVHQALFDWSGHLVGTS